MILRLHGKVNGKNVELDNDPGLPPDSPVTVELETPALSTEERRRGIMESFGVWKDDEEMARIFEQILREREHRPCRDVDSDSPS